LALFYLRQELELHLRGVEMSMHQWTINDPYYETLLRLTDLEADYIFFSVYIWNGDYTRRLVDDLLSLGYEGKIVLGGPQTAVFADLPAGCSVVLGEIEGVGKHFYDDLRRGDLKGCYQAGPADSFSSPYRREDFSSLLANRHVYYESTRGCPFFCAYCLSSTSRGVRSLPLEQVKKELVEIIAARPMIVKFIDRTFNADARRTLELWQFLAEQPGEATFHFEVAPDLFTEEMFELLAQVRPGRFQFEIGVQSVNPKSLEAVRRGMDVDLAARNISRLSAMGNIHIHVDLILGLPLESTESFKEAVDRVFAMAPHYVQMGLLKVLPGTAIAENASTYGIVARPHPPYQVLATSTMTHAEIRHLYLLGECIEAFYNNRYFRGFFSCPQVWERGAGQLFEDILTLSQRAGLFERAKTQKLLGSILVEYADNHRARQLLRELLIFDWLSCGHRYLPPELNEISLSGVGSHLWHEMPSEVEGLYDAATRNRFYKKGVFYRFSQDLLAAVGLVGKSGKQGYVYFLPDSGMGVFKRNRAMALC